MFLQTEKLLEIKKILMLLTLELITQSMIKKHLFIHNHIHNYYMNY